MATTLARLAGASMLMALFVGTNAVAAEPLSGASLYEDVRRYDGFGQHRYGSSGAARAFDWIADGGNWRTARCPRCRYPKFFGMAGRHLLLHTPADSAAATGSEALEPVIRAFADAASELAASKD
jgi:hypothetical protein